MSITQQYIRYPANQNGYSPIYTDDRYNVGILASVAANALTVTLTGSDGTALSTNNSALIAFGSTTAATGSMILVTQSTPVTLTVPSTATLGTTASQLAILWVYAVKVNTSVVLGISQTYYPDNIIVNTTILNASSNSNSPIYTSSAQTGVSIRLIGQIQITEATPGNWATAPSLVSTATPAISIPKVYARYHMSASTVVPDTTNTIINFDAVDADPYSCVTTGASWNFKAPYTGEYLISMCLGIPATAWTPTSGVIPYSYVNNARGFAFDQFNNNTVTTYSATVRGTSLLRLTAADTFNVQVVQTSGANMTFNNAALCYVSILLISDS